MVIHTVSSTLFLNLVRILPFERMYYLPRCCTKLHNVPVADKAWSTPVSRTGQRNFYARVAQSHLYPVDERKSAGEDR